MRQIWLWIKQHPAISIAIAAVGGLLIYSFIKSKQQVTTPSTGTPGQTQAGQQFYLVTLGGDEEAGMPINPGLPVPHPPIGPNPPTPVPPTPGKGPVLNTYTLFSPTQLKPETSFGPNSVLTWQGFAQGEYQDEYKYTLQSSWTPLQIAQAVPGVQVQQ